MIRFASELFLSAVLVLLVCPAVLAKDVIELKSGEKVEGKLIDEDRTEITVQTDETRLVLPKGMIKIMKVEVVDIYLSDGRKISGQIDKETDHSITLRMRLGGITIDKMDMEKLERRVEEQKPVIWEAREKEQRARITKNRKTGLEEIKWPEPTENLSVTEIRQLHGRAIQLLQAKKFKDSIDLYEKILRTNPKDSTALYNLACAYSLMGNKRKAIEYLRMSVAAGYTNFGHMERDTDLDSIRGEKGYKELLKKRDAIQLQAASRQLEELKKQFGEGYTYEIEETRKLIFATNQSLEILNRMKDHLFRFADAQWKMIWDNKPAYYITVVCPDRQAFRKIVPNPSVGGFYNPQNKILVCGDIGLTLDHEFTHSLHFADQEAKRMSAPIYIIEGFSTLFESSGFVGEKLKPRLISGRLNAIRQATQQGRHIPWEQFRVLPQAQYGGFQYAQGRYMFVYIYENDKLKKWYDKYCETYQQDRTGKVAWENIFGKGFSEIEQEWVTWVNGIKFEAPKRVRQGGPFLGVQSEECDEGIALYQVVPDSPADKGGLREGDILTHAEGQPIKTHNDFIDFLNSHNPGDTVKFKVIRGKKKKTVTVTLGNRPGR